MTATAGYLFEGADWEFEKLQRIHDACEEIARSELGLEIYPNQIEVITAEQMLDAYSSAGISISGQAIYGINTWCLDELTKLGQITAEEKLGIQKATKNDIAAVG